MNNKKILYIAIAAIVVIAAVVAGVFAFGGNNTTTTTEKPFEPSYKDSLELLNEVFNSYNATATEETMLYVGGGNPENALEEPTLDDNSSINSYDFASWVTKAKAEPWVRIEFQINRFTASGVKVEYSNNGGTTWSALTTTLMPENNEVWGDGVVRAFLTTEQNRRYSFRLVTGSGRVKVYEPSISNELYVKIDFTAPTLRSEAFRKVSNNSVVSLKDTWINEDAEYRIMPQDTALGSGINESSIRLMEYPIGVENEYILNGTIAGTAQPLNKVGDYFTYVMTGDKKYVLKFEDHAGNEY